MDKDIFHVGMDLGSFKTSVVASNGKRATMLTATGWPSRARRSLIARPTRTAPPVISATGLNSDDSAKGAPLPKPIRRSPVYRARANGSNPEESRVTRAHGEPQMRSSPSR